MGKFKESDYYKSEEHLNNLKKGSILGNKKIRELKEQRIIKYDLSPKMCKQCELSLSYEDRHKTYCSSSCAAKYNNTKRIMTDETRERIKNSMVGYYTSVPNMVNEVENTGTVKICKCCGTEFNVIKVPSGGISKTNVCSPECRYKLMGKKKKRYKGENKTCEICNTQFRPKITPSGAESKSKVCSKECSDNLKSSVSKETIRTAIESGKHNGWQSRNNASYPEKFFMNVLEDVGLGDEYEFNYPINKRADLGIDEPYNYFLDFYFPKKKLVLEIDGSQHKYRVEHDMLRDQRMSMIGIYTYRIQWKSINTDNGKEYIKEQINNFLNFYDSHI